MLQNSLNVEELNSLKRMIKIRECELIIGRGSAQKLFRTPIHLGIGQEAVAVGVANQLTNHDLVFGNHRSHAHYLASGAPSQSLFLEILGKAAGCSGGHGGSMHITAPEFGIVGTMPIVAGTIPIAAGAALTQKRSGQKKIAVAYFGDGAVEEGVFHETMNLASIMQLPILFVCENNVFSSHLHINERQPSNHVSRFADSNLMAHMVCDGNDLLEVENSARDLIQNIRETSKPGFLEANTYRLFGHVGFEKDEEIGLNRREELEKWEAHDPIQMYSQKLINEDKITESDIILIRENIVRELETEWEHAVSAVFPDSRTIEHNVYFEASR